MGKDKQIEYGYIVQLADDSIKANSKSSAHDSMLKLYKMSNNNTGEIPQLTNELFDAFLEINRLKYQELDLRTEQDIREYYTNLIVKAIEKGMEKEDGTQIKFNGDMERRGRGNRGKPDYIYTKQSNPNLPPDNTLLIEVKKFGLLKGNGELKRGPKNQLITYLDEYASKDGFGMAIVTNAEDILVYIKGKIATKVGETEPLLNNSTPIFMMNIRSLDIEACKVLAFLIYHTIAGTENVILKTFNKARNDKIELIKKHYEKLGYTIIKE